MNYEEILEQKTAAKAKTARLPLGNFSKRLIGEKYQNVLDLRPQLFDNIKFRGALDNECDTNPKLRHKNQLHFELDIQDSQHPMLLMEQGNFITLAQLIQEQPAIVAEKGFIDDLISQLLDITEFLHSQQIWHVCFAPQNILIRKGDHAPMLLSHGSFYLGLKKTADMYEGMERFVAPEVLNDGTVDNRCDIFSLGCLIDWIFEMAEIPYAYEKVAKRAQNDKPEGRYQTVADMRKALKRKRDFHKTLLTLVGALVVALLVVGLYFELMPEPTNVEYVKPAPRQATDDLIEDGFDPAELGVVSGDTLIMTEEERRNQAEYEAKAEQIFRKRFTEEADRVLSKIYNNEHMNSSEKKFLSDMSSVNEELLRLQVSIGDEAGISAARSQLIATQIVESLTEQKKKKLQYHGVQK